MDKSGFKLLVKALFSAQAMTELYEKRRALRPAEENRTKIAVFSATTLFASVLIFLLFMAYSRKDSETYLSSRTNIIFLDEEQSGWDFTGFFPKKCQYSTDCYLLSQNYALTPFAGTDYKLSFPPEIGNTDIAVSRIKTTIDPEDFLFLAERRTLVISMPRFYFQKADIFLNGVFHSSFYDSSLISIPFNTATRFQKVTSIELILEVQGSQTQLFPLKIGPLAGKLSLMTLKELRGYQDFIASNRAGRGNYVGQMARVVMAVFVLILFLLVDGAPETLGLGLFLGFEAFAISLGYDWLPISNSSFLAHFSFQMGDIFRLFFFLQLSRMIDKNVTKWLVWGTVLSVPYGLLRYYAAVNDIGGLGIISQVRDITIGVIGTYVCARSAYYLKDKQIPWRVLALVIASLGAFEQVFDPLLQLFGDSINYAAFVPLVNIYQPLGAWLLAFSAFINISTLENRVKTLSKIEAEAKDIQKEMELGKTVQEAFLSLPEIPDNIALRCHHEAMLYVSGDTYFADWNEKTSKLTFLINDVTGHGVQAALKASGVDVIANTIWNDEFSRYAVEERWTIYSKQVQRFYRRMNENPDIIAMGGGEFDLNTGEMTLYRVNFPFPILIEPKNEHHDGEESRKDDRWRIHQVPVSNEHPISLSLKEGTFVIICSDGFAGDSRTSTDLLRYLRRELNRMEKAPNSDELESLIMTCPLFQVAKLEDDRTLAIFHYVKSLNEKQQPSDASLPLGA